MILLERIIEKDKGRIVCEAVIRENAPFVETEGIRAHVTLEHMAQCIAAGAGIDSIENGEAQRLGFLVGCRNLTLHRAWIPIGSTLRISVDSQWGHDSLGLFHGEVHLEDELVSEASLSVVRLQPGHSPSVD